MKTNRNQNHYVDINITAVNIENIYTKQKAFKDNGGIDDMFNLLEKGKSLYVQSVFTDGAKNESMWIKVKSFDKEKQELIGLLDNPPTYIKNFALGDEVILEAEEVHNFMYVKGDRPLSFFPLEGIEYK